MQNFDLQTMQGQKFKTSITEEQAVCHFVDLMKTTSQDVANRSFYLTGLEKFQNLELPEEMDDIEELAKFVAQIDLSFDWPFEG